MNNFNLTFLEDLKKVYLFIYNLFQFVGYMYVMAVMGVRYVKLDYDSVTDTYEHVGSAMKFLQLMQYLEVLHPMFGYTKVRDLISLLDIPYYVSEYPIFHF